MKKLSLVKLTNVYGLKPTQLMLYTVLLKITKKYGRYQNGYKYLSEKLNIDTMTVLKNVQRLEEKKLVTIERKVGQKLRITAIEGDVYID